MLAPRGGEHSILPRIRRIYLAQVDAKIHRLRLAIDAFEKHTTDEVTRAQVHRLFHNLAGSAGCYGFPQVTGIAREVMAALEAGEHHHDSPEWRAQALRILNESVAAIAMVFEAARGEEELVAGYEGRSDARPPALDGQWRSELAVVVCAPSPDTPLVTALRTRHACHVVVATAVSDVVCAIRDANPWAVVVDEGWPRSHLVETLKAARSAQSYHHLPIVLAGVGAELADELALPTSDLVLPAPLADVRDLEELVRQVATIHRMAQSDMTRDEATGLYNAAYLREHLEYEVRRARRYRHQLSLALVDLDHFANFNAVYGPQVGDELLARFGAFLATSFRATDTLARIAGNTFAVLMPETMQKSGLRAVLRVLEELRRNGLDTENADLPSALSFSAGVACYPANADGSEALIEEAYEALQCAKRAGRNRAYASRRSLTT